ncbi:MAG: hypothetical protein Q9227_000086 [Pyrenula ochraceoflavens]
MGQHDLQAASTYINNSLISRGLLRKGEEIEWARPKNHPGGADATMVKIIRLVNDLIVNKDRDEQHRESLADTIRKVRVVEQKQTLEAERLQAKNRDSERLLAVSKNQESVLRESAKRAEYVARDLRKEILKHKADLEKARGQFVNENRRRDLEVQKLKRHIDDLQRGRRDGPLRSGGDLDQLERNQNNSFLADKLGSVCKENDAVRALMKETMKELRKMTDVKNLNNKDSQDVQATNGDSTYALGSYDAISKEVSTVLDQCRSVLEDPSFVSIESVEEAFREQESYIRELRSGWEKMAGRLRQTQEMMVSWKERMMDGDSIDLNDLGVGLDLGKSIAAPIFDDAFFTSSDSRADGGSAAEVEAAPSEDYQLDEVALETVNEDTEEIQDPLQNGFSEKEYTKVSYCDNDAQKKRDNDPLDDANSQRAETQSYGKRKSLEAEEPASEEAYPYKRQQKSPEPFIALSPSKRGVPIPKSAVADSNQDLKPSIKPGRKIRYKATTHGSPKLFSSPIKEPYHPTFSLDSEDASLLSVNQELGAREASLRKPLFTGISPLKTSHNANVAPQPHLTISEKLAAAAQEATEAAVAEVKDAAPGDRVIANVATKRRPIAVGARGKARRKRKSTLTREELDSLLLN